MFSCLQILEAFLWFVLITLLNVTLIILTLSVSRLLNLLLRLVAFLLFLNPQCLASKYGNLPPREISMKDVFRSGDSSKKFKIAEGQWYRYAPSYVSPAYHLLEGFPFIQEPPSGDLQERVLIRHHDYYQCFQSVQLLQWNSQVKFNVTVYRNLPTTRDSIMTS